VKTVEEIGKLLFRMLNQINKFHNIFSQAEVLPVDPPEPRTKVLTPENP
jgi:hypothetical protein